MKPGVAIVVVTILIGCASAPEHKPPAIDVEVPMEWTGGKTGQTEPPDWWLEFNDGQLDTLVGEALESNIDLRVAVARVDAAAAAARITKADLLPQASLRGDANRRRQNLLGIPIPGSPDLITTRVTSFGVSLDIDWEIDLWGRIRAGEAGALADLEATWADLAAARLSLAGQTAKAWFALIEAYLQVDLALQTVESYRLSTEQVQKRYEQGVRSSLDLRLALANRAGAEALLERRRVQLDVATRQLEILLGRYPAGAIEPPDDLPQVAAAVPGGLPSDLLIRRPDLLAAERRFAAGEKRVSQARRAFFPQIRLTASGGTLTQEFEDLVDGNFSVWSIAAGLMQPVFQGGRLRANLSQSHAFSDQALAQYATALLRAFGEVESALMAEGSLTRQETHLRIAAEQSMAARELAERQYDTGLADYITVLETQRRELVARGELLTVRRLRLDARVNLHLALGGGFDLEDEWNRFLEPNSGPMTEDPSESQ